MVDEVRRKAGDTCRNEISQNHVSHGIQYVCTWRNTARTDNRGETAFSGRIIMVCDICVEFRRNRDGGKAYPRKNPVTKLGRVSDAEKIKTIYQLYDIHRRKPGRPRDGGGGILTTNTVCGLSFAHLGRWNGHFIYVYIYINMDESKPQRHIIWDTFTHTRFAQTSPRLIA